MSTLNEKTTVPLWAALGVVPVLVGFIFWLSVIYVGGQANASNITDLKGRVDAQYQILLDIRDRLIRLEDAQNSHKHKE